MHARARTGARVTNRLDFKTIEFPVVVHARLVQARLHHRQALWEVVESALDYWEEAGGWDPGTRPSYP